MAKKKNEKRKVYYKGFDKDLKCRDFQYEIGGTYETDEAKLCESGFHACEAPLAVMGYYPPNESRYCEVELDGVSDEKGDDTKVAAKKITVGAEIGIPGLVKAHVEWVKEHTTTKHIDPKQATAGSRGAATAGYAGAATAGEYGAATAGEYGAATAGYAGAATAGYAGAALSRGSSASGDNGVSVARGDDVKVKGGLGALLVLAVERSDSFDLVEWKAAIVDGKRLKADTWYTLKGGKFVKWEGEE